MLATSVVLRNFVIKNLIWSSRTGVDLSKGADGAGKNT